MAGTAKVAFAAGLAKSTSAEAVVPVRLTGVGVLRQRSGATGHGPIERQVEMDALAASVD
jgi:hypothetical protein